MPSGYKTNPNDYINKKYNRLTVIDVYYITDSRGNKRTVAKCRCDCGNVIDTRLTAVSNGYVKSCGCINTEKSDLCGKKFGRLTVIELVEKGKHNRWRCKCNCGNEVIVIQDNLVGNKQRSCGCLIHEKFKDLTGLRFGRLVVLGLDKVIKKNRYWLCKCDCGNVKSIQAAGLKSGATISCGCYRDEVSRIKKKHGLSEDKSYYVWAGMRDRCKNKNSPEYKNYGARGIKVCKEWDKSFESFYNWYSSQDHFEERGYTLDRIYVNGDYSPENCRLADKHTQCANKRKTKANTSGFVGVYKNKYGWVARVGVNYEDYRLGTYESAEEARIARVKFLRKNNLTEYPDYYDNIEGE